MATGTLEQNTTIPIDVADIPTSKTYKSDKDIKLDGHNMWKAFSEYNRLHKIIPSGDDRINYPEIREKGVKQNVGTLEEIVKNVLGSEERASEESALKIIAALGLEGIKAKGFRLHKDDQVTDELTKYLKGYNKFEKFADLSEQTKMALGEFYQTVAGAIGDPNAGNFISLQQALINLPAVKPGALKYDENSVAARIMRYIAGLIDNPTPGHKWNTPKRLTYLQQQLAQFANHPQYAFELQRLFNSILPDELKVKTLANLDQMLGAFTRYVATKDAQYNAATSTTYTLKNPTTKPSVDGAVASTAKDYAMQSKN